LPGALYVNQYGDAFETTAPGMKSLNSVFNTIARSRQARYLEQVFRNLGTDWFAVRLGGGWFGELNYPPHEYRGRKNCYWAYDEAAQAQCPVPGWRPGEPKHAAAFLDWYLESLRQYHDWQIATARRWYRGKLMMLYPSWGIRSGQIETAVAGNLAGTTSVERNGEIQRGFDWARCIAGIRDPMVIVHTTWLDAPGNDNPIHFLSALARPHGLKVSGENTGGGDLATLRLCLDRARRYDCVAFFWAFEKQLFDGLAPTLADMKKAIHE
jgi:hypothetical protein